LNQQNIGHQSQKICRQQGIGPAFIPCPAAIVALIHNPVTENQRAGRLALPALWRVQLIAPPQGSAPFFQPGRVTQDDLHQLGVIEAERLLSDLGKNDANLAVFIPLLYQTRAPFWFAEDSDPVTTIVFHRRLPDHLHLITFFLDSLTDSGNPQVVNEAWQKNLSSLGKAPEQAELFRSAEAENSGFQPL
jgi:hypothetical protein